jgi:hypothetical protein
MLFAVAAVVGPEGGVLLTHPLLAVRLVVEAAVEAEVTPEMRVGLEAQEERAEQEPIKHLTAYLSHQGVQHPLQWLLQEVKSLYHGTHNDISTRYLLRW